MNALRWLLDLHSASLLTPDLQRRIDAHLRARWQHLGATSLDEYQSLLAVQPEEALTWQPLLATLPGWEAAPSPAAPPACDLANLPGCVHTKHQLIERMQIPVIMHQDYRVVYANDAALQTMRATQPSDFIGQEMLRFVPERFHADWTRRVEALYAGERTSQRYQTEMVVYRVDGTSMRVEVGGGPLELAGRPGGQLYFRDITTERETLHALRQTQLRLDLAQEVALVGAWEYNFQTEDIWWSDSLYGIGGLDKEQDTITPERFFALLHPDDVAMVHQRLHDTIVHDAPYKFDHRIVTPDQRVKICHASAYLFRGPKGEPMRLVGATQDITEQKLREREIERLNQTLERQVAHRTAALQASNDELRRFAYSVSHDLRAPLRHLNSYSQLLTRHLGARLDERGSEYLGFIREATQRMEALIEGLLSYSRLGQRSFEPTWLDLNQLIASLWPTLLTAEARDRFTLRCDPLPSIRADAFLMGQVLANLLGNAIKYSSQQAAPHIDLRGKVEDGYVVLSLRDNGIGFDMRYADRLFQLFQRLPGSEAYEGTGVGLANSLRIVRRHGGTIWAESQPGQGACFYLRLPRQGPSEEELAM